MTGTILLTGSTGFVGRQILAELSRQKIPVRRIIRANYLKKSNEPPRQPGEVVETPDMFSESVGWWESACSGIDTIIHSAWYAEPGEYLYSGKNIDCLKGTLSLAQGAIGSGVRRIVGIGTCLEYDLEPGFLSTTTRLNPLTPYAAAKAATYTALSSILGHAGIGFSWCRLFYLYGEGEDPRRLVPYIRNSLKAGKVANLGTGNQIRDYLNVREAGRMIVEEALGDNIGPKNICSGVPITIRQIAEEIANETGNHHLLKFSAVSNNAFDPPKIVGINNE
ncbi:MAG: NAD(P)-dependent oxidoreductase [Gammaproteobacteria bacterium]